MNLYKFVLFKFLNPLFGVFEQDYQKSLFDIQLYYTKENPLKSIFLMFDKIYGFLNYLPLFDFLMSDIGFL